MNRRSWWWNGRVTALCLAVLVIHSSLEAGTHTLTSGNSTLTIDTAKGVSSWVVDGVPHLALQQYWVRVGSQGSPALLRDPISESREFSSVLRMYFGLVELTYTLVGGSPGSGESRLEESLRLQAPLERSDIVVHIFRYADLDLDGTSGGDQSEWLQPSTIRQFKDRTTAEAVATPAPAHFDMAVFPSILSSLTSGSTTDLDDSPASLGPGNVTYAVQWALPLPTRSTATASHSTRIKVAPPSLTIDDRAVPEGSAANAAFRVALSGSAVQTVTVDYSTADGTATAPSDYAATSGSLTFTPGRKEHSIFVPIVTDAATEGDETFYVNLKNATNATILDGQAAGTIADPPAAAKSAMYRSYNKSTDYHFFTTDLASKNFAVGVLGFQDESNPPPFYVSNVQLTSTVPLFRMYNPNLGRHFYTASTGSRDFLMGIGAVYEKEEGFVYPLGTSPQPAGTTELFLLYNNSSGTHLFTADPQQKNGILSLFTGIWVQHTSVGFVFTGP